MLDIVGFVERSFVDWRQRQSDIYIHCPFCPDRVGKEDTKYHMGINLEREVVHCFRCGYSGSWIKFVMDYMNVDYIHAIGELYTKPRMVDWGQDAIDKMYIKEETSPIPDAKLPNDFQLLTQDTSPLALRAKQYMRKRGFGKEYWTKYKIGVAQSLGMRVVIPIEDGYWQARRLLDCMEPKYLNPTVPAEHVLFNASALQKYDEVAVCEGAFSAMAVGPNAIAMISKEPTAPRISRMLQSPCNNFVVTIEPGAFKSMQKLTDALVGNGKSVTLWVYDVGDPADPDQKLAIVKYTLKDKLKLLMNL